MDYQFFHSMTKEEAKQYLDDFLEFGRNRSFEILAENVHFTVDLDFSLESVSNIFKSLSGILKTIPRDPDPGLPEFIRNSETYKKNLFDFDERSKPVILAAAYYLGESFVRSFRQLRWSLGDTKYHQANMPVVTGFISKMELAPVLVAENMFAAAISGMRDADSIDEAIETWTSFV